MSFLAPTRKALLCAMVFLLLLCSPVNKAGYDLVLELSKLDKVLPKE
jgi:uncharacterized membrane protein